MIYSIAFWHRVSYKSSSCKTQSSTQVCSSLFQNETQFSRGRLSCTLVPGIGLGTRRSRATVFRGKIARCSGLVDDWNSKICPRKEPLKCVSARFLLYTLYFPCWITTLGNPYSAPIKNMGKLLIWAQNLCWHSPGSADACVTVVNRKETRSFKHLLTGLC